MKISLNIRSGSYVHDPSKDGKASERDIAACRDGDWEARDRLLQIFHPLLISLAKQRSHDPAMVANLVEAGRAGLLAAVKKYRPTGDSDKFQIFALDFIEKNMDEFNRPKSFWARLFNKE